MRIKFLSVIMSFLLVTFAMSSCLGDDETIEYSPNALIMAFSLDTIHGVDYPFTIDQLNGKIYNADSLPVGSDTIIDKILIAKLSAAGYVGTRNYNNTADTILNIEDSLNLTGTMQNPFLIIVYPQDGGPKKTYSLSVRVHQQQPDSLNWGKDALKTDFAPAITGKQKSIIFKDQIFIYAAGLPVYSTSLSDGRTWTSAAASGLPSTNLTSIVTFNHKLYATVEGNGTVYSSDDGRIWNETPAFGEVVRLISPINNLLTGIKVFAPETVERFCTTTDGMNWTPGEIAPHSFPRNNISATVYNIAPGVENIMVVGNVIDPVAGVDTATVAWGFMEGQEWAALNTETQYACPLLEDPSIMYYGEALYIFGNDFKTFYKSDTGLYWSAVDKEFMFPLRSAGTSATGNNENTEPTNGFRGDKSDYSMVVDKENNNIWIMRSTPNAVWRGYMNRLYPQWGKVQ